MKMRDSLTARDPERQKLVRDARESQRFVGKGRSQVTPIKSGAARRAKAASVLGDGARTCGTRSRDGTADYKASFFMSPEDAVLPTSFAKALLDLEEVLGLPVWLINQPFQRQGDEPFHRINHDTVEAFFKAMSEVPRRPIALVLESPGGDARCAWELATFLRKHCGGYTVIVPSWAKSAATLLALGAERIVLGKFGELGPLDAQTWDEETEKWQSGLDRYQTLDYLNAFALQSFDKGMDLLVHRLGKRPERLMAPVQQLTAQVVRPLFEKVDLVRWTEVARQLKVGEDYATRLLVGRYGPEKAQEIAHRLVTDYSEHSFPIDADEARSIGLEITPTDAELEEVLMRLRSALPDVVAVGRLTTTEGTELRRSDPGCSSESQERHGIGGEG